MNTETLLVVVLAMEAVIGISLFTLLYQLLKQQGRILLRLDDLDQRMTISAAAITEHPESEAAGLSVGSPFPTFRFPDLAGQGRRLTDFEGKRPLLVHWSAECSFCVAIGRDLALLEDAFSKAGVQLVLLSRSDASSTQKQAKELRLNCPILLAKEGSEALEIFNDFGPPAAYLLDEKCRVAHPVVVGSDRILNLARQLAAGTEKKRLPGERSLAQSRMERGGLKAGTPAPAFHLPDLSGRTVSLKDYWGQKLLLVFTDPHCGPCDQIAPELVRLHREHKVNGLSLVMVGRGDVEENRKKAELNGFDFPVVLQKKWELSKRYGIFATPVAFLIDEKGVIARDVAIGADPILDLAEHAVLTGQGALI